MSYNDLADVDMTGVKPAGDFKELEVGQYPVRIEDAGICPSKDKFDKETGAPDPDNGLNYMLRLHLKVHAGPDAGHEEQVNLNLWNMNDTAVSIAKSSLLSLQQATNTVGQGSLAFIGKWLILEVYLNRTGKKAQKYLPMPLAHVPPGIPAVEQSRYLATASETLIAKNNAQVLITKRKQATSLGGAASAQVVQPAQQQTTQPTAQAAYTPSPQPAQPAAPAEQVPGWLLAARAKQGA